MNRKAYKDLLKWKESKTKKPLIIQGVRQVGKTWLMQEFGKKEFHEMVYFNFESNRMLHGIFKGDFDIPKIISMLEIAAGQEIHSGKTLVIFDEIQSCPEAITSLKYFYENVPELHILAAGSLLGVAIHQGVSFPVGKVDFLHLRPLSFDEYLLALGHYKLLNLIEKKQINQLTVFHDQLLELLKEYLFIGGMPEVVKVYSENKNFKQARSIQSSIQEAYEKDFSKHAPVQVIPRIRMIWSSIVGQLAKENSKFLYSLLRKGARAKEFELAIEWLKDAGLIHKVHRISKPGLPIQAYADWKDFKLYVHDVGILGSMAEMSPDILLKGDLLFTEFKGIITEQYVHQQLLSESATPFYWSPEAGESEVDFIIQKDQHVIPLEVKSSINLRSKSLRIYYDKFHPAKCIRFSTAPYRKQDWMENIPLYAISWAI